METINVPSPSNLLLIMVVLGILPFFILMATSYVKFVVIIGLVKNALGLQQIPPTIVVNGFAIVMSVYVMAPVYSAAFEKFNEFGVESYTDESLLPAAIAAAGPIREFLYENSSLSNRRFFLQNLRKTWPESEQYGITQESLIVLVPAFTVTELTVAFQIGFVLFLPFIVIDLVVSNILLSMGMMMVSPMTISLPFKLLLFVLVSGWGQLFRGIIETYH